MVNEYIEKINQIKQYIQIVKQDAEYLNDKNTVNKLEELEGYIEDEHFNLIVVGEFSRGKSTFVNALMGKRILPSATNPTTATLNVIENGQEEPAYTIHYHNGKIKEVSEAEFKTIIAPELISSSRTDQMEYVKEIGEIQNIKHVHIAVQNQLGMNGISIIDTPGVNDLDTRREQITYNYIPKADAAIVILSATPLLSASENKFICEKILKNDISKLFVVINFKDILKFEEDYERVLHEARMKLNGIVPENRIFLVSAKRALAFKRKMNGENVKNNVPVTLHETGFEEMEDALYDFLISERGNIKLERFRAVLRSTVRDMLDNAYITRMQTIHMSKEELEKTIKEIRPTIQKKKMQCTNELESLKRTLLMEQDALEKEYRKLLTAVAYKAKKAVESYSGNVPEEVVDRISDETSFMEKELQVEFPNRIQEMITNHVKYSLNRIGEDVATIGVKINFFEKLGHKKDILTMSDVETLDMTEHKRKDEDAEALLTLGALAGGFILGATVGLAALPLVYVGGMILDSYLETQGNEGADENNAPVVTSASVRKVFMAEITQKYFNPIEDRVREFRKNYTDQVSKLVKKVQKECDMRLEQSVQLLELELEEKQNESLSMEQEMNDLNVMKQRLENILRM